MNKPIVSFIIPTRNRRRILEESLSKIEQASKGIDKEIIVIDNASSDDTVKSIQTFFPLIRLYKNNFNLGSEARNIGIKGAQGKYIFCLDDDSYPLGDSVACGIDIMEEDPAIGCLAYRIEMPGNRFWTNGLHTSFAGCGVMFSKKAIDQAGGYPCGYGYYVEEYDVSFRILALGYRLVNVKNLKVFHQQANEERNIDEIFYRLVSNNVKLYSKFFPPEQAVSQISFELFRYRVIAEKENALGGFLKGLEHSFLKIFDNNCSNNNTLRANIINRLLGYDDISKKIKTIFVKGKKCRVAVYRIGKLFPMIIECLKTVEGVQISGVFENNSFFIGKIIKGIKVLSFDDIRSDSFDLILCGSSSLSVNDQVEAEIKGNNSLKEKEFFRVCEYDYI